MQHTPISARIGRYEVLAQLGRGAMGVVYQARDPQIDRLVAIKTILWMGDEPDEAHDYRLRFTQEAKAAGRLSHPGIVQVFDVGEDTDSRAPFIVMEYVAGQSLNKLLGASPGTKLPLDRALQLAEEIAEALAYAHSQGVVHRDIKPANILVTEDGRAKIADFGVAKLDFSNLTIAGHAVGTPAYMAPEQLAGAHVDGRADLFSLGVILYSMVSGFRPFQGRGNSTIAHKVRHGEPLPVSTFEVHLPAEVDALLSRAMAKDPADRFQSGSEMASALRKLRGADPSMSSTDVRAVMQETGAHVACMSSDKSQKTATSTQQPGAPATKAIPATKQITAAATTTPAQSTLPKSTIKNQKSKIFLAAALAAALIAACTLAWRLHASMRPTVAPEPVAWETAPANAASTQPQTTVPANTSSQAEPASTTWIHSNDAHVAAAPAVQKPAASKPKGRANSDNEVVADRTVRLARSTPAPASERLVRVAKTTAAPLPAPKPAIADTATLQLALEHSFDSAQVTVWVGDHEVLTESLHGEKKRLLVFQRTRGTFMNKVSVPGGHHLVRVRIQSPGDSFDATQSINADFTNTSQYVLHARCDKKRKEIKLDLAPAAVTSAN